MEHMTPVCIGGGDPLLGHCKHASLQRKPREASWSFIGAPRGVVSYGSEVASPLIVRDGPRREGRDRSGLRQEGIVWRTVKAGAGE